MGLDKVRMDAVEGVQQSTERSGFQVKKWLEAITGKRDIHLDRVEADVDCTAAGAEVQACMDLVCWAEDNTVYGLKLLQDWADASVGRGLHYMSSLGLLASRDKEDWECPEVWAIFLCCADTTGSGDLLYHDKGGLIPGTERFLRHFVFMNCAYQPEDRKTGLPKDQEDALLGLIHGFHLCDLEQAKGKLSENQRLA